MCYDKALRILARMEYLPGTTHGREGGEGGEGDMQGEASQAWVERLVEKKFSHVVSAQVGDV